MDDHGLISWSGHPDNRDLTLDLAELREGRHLIDIEDWLDDPEEPRLDPVEYPNNVRPPKKPKSLADTFSEQNEKFQFFIDVLSKCPQRETGNNDGSN